MNELKQKNQQLQEEVTALQSNLNEANNHVVSLNDSNDKLRNRSNYYEHSSMEFIINNYDIKDDKEQSNESHIIASNELRYERLKPQCYNV